MPALKCALSSNAIQHCDASSICPCSLSQKRILAESATKPIISARVSCGRILAEIVCRNANTSVMKAKVLDLKVRAFGAKMVRAFAPPPMMNERERVLRRRAVALAVGEDEGDDIGAEQELHVGAAAASDTVYGAAVTRH